MAGQFALVVAQGDIDEVGDVAPFQARLDVARFQPGHVQQIADQPVQARGAFLDFPGQVLCNAEWLGVFHSARAVAAVVMAEMGVRNSWEMEFSSALLNFSDSATSCACLRLPHPAAAGPAPARPAGRRRPANRAVPEWVDGSPANSTPSTPTAPRLVCSGT